MSAGRGILAVMRVAFMLLLLDGGAALADTARVDSVNALGRSYIFANVASSIDLYEDLAREAGEQGYARGEAQALQNRAVALYLRGRHDDSVAAYLRAIRLYEREGLREDLASAYGDLGYQMKRRDLPGALGYMREAITILEGLPGPTGLDPLYDNYGVLQEMAEAPDSAAHYYRKALALKVARNDSIGIPYSLNNLAGIHMARREFAPAESLLVRSDAIRRSTGDAYGLLVNEVQWGDLFYQRGELSAAERRYRATLERPGAGEQGFLMTYCYRQLTSIYEQQHDFERAYVMQRRSTAFQDSLVNVETNARIAALEIEYESERKDRKLAESALAIEARTRQVLMLVSSLGLLLMIALAVIGYQGQKRRQLRRELELRGRLRQIELERHLSDEKLRISRELHDNIGAQLTFLISSLDNLAHGDRGKESGDRLASLGDFGRDTLGELRQTVWAMKSEEAGLDALELRLRQLKRQCAGADATVELEVLRHPDAPTALGSMRMLNIYRIAQEAVQNALKHAGAERITLRLQADDAELLMRIEDDGRGIDPDDDGSGNGIVNMRQRCEELGGRFSLERLARGSAVECRFPSK